MLAVNEVGGEWNWGTFENEYVKQDGVWKLKSVHVYPRLFTDYDKGWKLASRPGRECGVPAGTDRRPVTTARIRRCRTRPSTNPIRQTGKVTQYPAGAAVWRRCRQSPAAQAAVATCRSLTWTSDSTRSRAKIARARARDGAEKRHQRLRLLHRRFPVGRHRSAVRTRRTGRSCRTSASTWGRDRVTNSMKMRYTRTGTHAGKPAASRCIRRRSRWCTCPRTARARASARGCGQWGGGAQGSWIGRSLRELRGARRRRMEDSPGMDLDYVLAGWIQDRRTKVAANDNASIRATEPRRRWLPIVRSAGRRSRRSPTTFDVAFPLSEPGLGADCRRCC
jgi:hypothetical protein